ncbi:SAM and U-box domain-containing protein 1 [Seminavis robusta]|uniref:SAM and U-box domain-containing protein 1 n=1 Tax=Seminavis robusta TaxID=568900 RepID=A0A9N8DNQ6_9STRA|nr:SAM and U-box domain-containing protein 1 [Seminavis robusta]|eukprot:Sro181_g079080.1 SAM and U-box domain-containing protein 1 (113) ;mRNA; r:46208-46546
MNDSTANPPDAFLCPLTLEVMQDPVINRKTGHLFEKKAILRWIQRGNNTCPLTRLPLELSDLEEDIGLRYEISEWKEVLTMHEKLAGVSSQYDPKRLRRGSGEGTRVVSCFC